MTQSLHADDDSDADDDRDADAPGLGGVGLDADADRDCDREGNRRSVDVAKAYAAIKWHVLPLEGKLPVTQHGQHDATIDNATIDLHFTRNEDIGIACAPSGIIVVDVDPRNGGDVSFAALERTLGALPQTATSDTGGGGNHYVFKHPGGTLSGKIGKGIDLKVNGYIVAPHGRPRGRSVRTSTPRSSPSIRETCSRRSADRTS
ncbi:MAG: bifunctional DNA primase/polymerase [Proteobacteria bacterium]|nr:bifunctional DNA primase/polymerase [Pseudomonadota bacterium]